MGFKGAHIGVLRQHSCRCRGGEQLADVSQHSDSHGAASLLLLPVPALQPQPAASEAGSAAAADQPFQAAGVFGVGLGPDVPARRA